MNSPSGPSGKPGLKPRDRLQVAIIINQLATPGLGSWMAGYKLAGFGQLLLAFAGFVLFVRYFVHVIQQELESVQTGLELALPPASWWQWGLILFGTAWLWSCLTSFQMFLRLRARKASDGSIPPRLSLP